MPRGEGCETCSPRAESFRSVPPSPVFNVGFACVDSSAAAVTGGGRSDIAGFAWIHFNFRVLCCQLGSQWVLIKTFDPQRHNSTKNLCPPAPKMILGCVNITFGVILKNLNFEHPMLDKGTISEFSRNFWNVDLHTLRFIFAGMLIYITCMAQSIFSSKETQSVRLAPCV